MGKRSLRLLPWVYLSVFSRNSIAKQGRFWTLPACSEFPIHIRGYPYLGITLQLRSGTLRTDWKYPSYTNKGSYPGKLSHFQVHVLKIVFFLSTFGTTQHRVLYFNFRVALLAEVLHLPDTHLVYSLCTMIRATFRTHSQCVQELA